MPCHYGTIIICFNSCLLLGNKKGAKTTLVFPVSCVLCFHSFPNYKNLFYRTAILRWGAHAWCGRRRSSGYCWLKLLLFFHSCERNFAPWQDVVIIDWISSIPRYKPQTFRAGMAVGMLPILLPSPSCSTSIFNAHLLLACSEQHCAPADVFLLVY